AGKLLRTTAVHPAPVREVGFLAGGTRLLTAGGDGLLRVWNAGADGGLTPRGPAAAVPGPVTSFAVAADGRRVLVGTELGVVALWDAADNRVVRLWEAGGSVAAVALSPDGKVAVCGGDATYLWDVDDGRPGVAVRGADGARAFG